jgi:hypothetical protein
LKATILRVRAEIARKLQTFAWMSVLLLLCAVIF